MVDVRPPRSVEVRRRRPDRITLGDSATVEEGPELLQLLMRPFGGNTWPLGRAIHPMTTVPLGLAIDAAIEAAGGQAMDVATLRYASISMEAFTSNRRPLRATARIAALGARHVEAEVEVWEVTEGQGSTGTGSESLRVILKGRIGLVRVRGGRAAPLYSLLALDQ